MSAANFLSKNQSILSLIIALVTITIAFLTLQQIRTQTDRSKLSLKADVVEAIQGLKRPFKDIEELSGIYATHSKSFEVLTSKKYLVVQIKNIGNINMLEAILEVWVEIDSGPYLNKKKVTGASLQWTIKINDTIEPNSKKEIVVAEVGSFPYAKFRWRINYRDRIQDKHSEFLGDSIFETKNQYAFSFNNAS